MRTVATQKQIYSSVNAPTFIPTVLTFEEMCSLLKSILCSSITHYSAVFQYLASVHIAAQPAMIKHNNSVSKQHSDILKLSQTMSRLVWSLSQETFILSKCLFTSEKVDSSIPGKLVLLQGALEALCDLSTSPPLHSEKNSIQYHSESSHAWTCTWIHSFPDHCIYHLLCLRKF